MNPGARKGPFWTPAEDAVIRELATTTEASDLAAKLPGRTQSAVFHRMRKLGIQKRRRWTAADDRKLEMLWGKSLKVVAAELGRTMLTTYWRAQKLGLGLGVPQGGEYMSAAARRTGYAISTLWMILRWAGVRPLLSLARERTERSTHWVDPDDVNDAIEKWLLTETPEAAARRHGYSAECVIQRLIRSGLAVPPRPGKRCHWRIPSEIIDQSMAMFEKRGRHLVMIRKAA